VYNAAPYLEAAIESILAQTFTDFTLYAIADLSRDNSSEIIKHYIHLDSRIQYIPNKHKGLVGALNLGLEISKDSYEYIARMDADDISHPRRFEKQLNFMNQNQHIDICGSAFKLFGSRKRTIVRPTTNDEIKIAFMFDCTMAHPSLVFRSKCIKKYSITYPESKIEDYTLWTTLFNEIIFHNLSNVLLYYRVHENSKFQKDNQKVQSEYQVKQHYLNKTCGFQTSVDESYLLNMPTNLTTKQLIQMLEFMAQLQQNKPHYFNGVVLFKYLQHRFFRFCFLSSRSGMGVWRIWKESPFYQTYHSLRNIELWVRCLFKISR
tara:strand:- start:2860 stop:3819 length:960 start_codon:yes stop_codon:yes gene_type:complete